MNKKTKYNLIGLAMAGLLIALDQWTKALAVKYLMNQQPFVIWDGVFELHYLENRGAGAESDFFDLYRSGTGGAGLLL